MALKKLCFCRQKINEILVEKWTGKRFLKLKGEFTPLQT